MFSARESKCRKAVAIVNSVVGCERNRRLNAFSFKPKRNEMQRNTFVGLGLLPFTEHSREEMANRQRHGDSRRRSVEAKSSRKTNPDDAEEEEFSNQHLSVFDAQGIR